MPATHTPTQAAEQDGLFTRRQARDGGWSRDRIRRLLQSGLWVRVVGEVMVAVQTPLTPSRRCRAAAMATSGVVSHLSAGLLWGFPPVGRTREEPLEVVVDPERNPRLDQVRVHRVLVPAADVTELSGIPVTTRERTLADCLAALSYARSLALLDHAFAERWVTLEALAERVRLSAGRHGVRQLRRLLLEARGGSRSEAERVLHRLLAQAGIRGWSANVPLEPAAGVRAVVDVWFPAARLAVEVDGRAWHVSTERFQRDRSRQNALVLAGCAVLRFTWADLTRFPDRVLREIEAALREPTDRYAPEPRRTGP